MQTRPNINFTRRMGILLVSVFPFLNSCQHDERPNIVLISVDTLRADHVSAYGYARETTPRIDALAKEGVLYKNAISPGTWTVPSHASIFTGLLPSFHGAYRLPKVKLMSVPLDERFVTLAEVLAEHGYDTAAFVGNSGYLAQVFGLGQGFQEYEDQNLWRADHLNEKVFSWLDKDMDRPFFLFVNYLDPHEPYSPPPPFDTAFPGRLETSVDPSATVQARQHPLTPEEKAHYLSQYDGEIRFTDHHVGLLFEKLKEQGAYESSLIIVTSDHGELIGEHGLYGHNGHGAPPYDPLIKVPLIAKYPKGARTGVVFSHVSTLDIMPTVLELLDLEAPHVMQGRPLDSSERPIISEVFTQDGEAVRSVYDGNYKLLIAGEGDSERSLLFDLSADPTERHPVTDLEEKTQTLKAHLEAAVGSAPSRSGVTPEISEEVLEKLRSLGYIR